MFREIKGAVEVKKGKPCKFSDMQMLDVLGDQTLVRSKWFKKAHEKIGITRSLAYEIMKRLESEKKVFENTEGEMERSAN